MEKSQKKKLWIGIAIGATISGVTLFALFIVLMLFFFLGGPAEVTTDILKYEETITKYEYMQTALIVFPEQIPENAQNVDFYFEYRDTWDDPTMEVFLQCTYDEADYQIEKERLENTQKRYGSVVRDLIRDEEGRYPYSAYIAIDGHSYAYEYALLTGERQITYIYVSFKNEDSLEKVDKMYLPKDFDERPSELGFGEGYSIYLESEYIENGVVSGLSHDYTRDAVVEVWQYHTVDIGYNWFRVGTCLDEKDTEIIQECSYVYYKNRHDSIYGLPKEVPYTDLKGYRFKSVELNENKTKAIVTYYEGEEEKTMEYAIPEV